MYEAILGNLDALAACFGLPRDNQIIRPGINPWGYSGGGEENPQMKEGREEIGTELEKWASIEIEMQSVQSRTALVAKVGVTST